MFRCDSALRRSSNRGSTLLTCGDAGLVFCCCCCFVGKGSLLISVSAFPAKVGLGVHIAVPPVVEAGPTSPVVA